MSPSRSRSCILLVAVVSFAIQAIAPTAHAGLIDTQTVVDSANRAANVARVNQVLSQSAVQERLQAHGVDPIAAEARVAQLSDAELAKLADDLENAPAGGDALALVGAVFVVLLILELTGVIDIFKKV
jgi:hypothetical protein